MDGAARQVATSRRLAGRKRRGEPIGVFGRDVRVLRGVPDEDLPKAAARPGLVLLATGDDAVGTETQRREATDAATRR